MANKMLKRLHLAAKNHLNKFLQMKLTQQNILELLKLGPSTRRDLVDFLNLPRTTVYDNLIKLQKQKLVERFTRNNGKVGRPLVMWKLTNGGSE